MEGKKISFGFLKTKKQDKPVTETGAEKREYIECVEEKSIKVVGGEVTEEAKPLIIPMKPNTLITAEKLKEIAAKVESFDEPEVKIEKEEEKAPENETLDQMAVRELMEGAKKIKKENETEELVVPINAKPVMEGQAEATLDDYESVPIQDFGLAMLRGMGWTPGKDQSKYKEPQLRPKGLGLGADKVIKDKEKNKSTKDKEEELSIVKNSFVKITTGKYNGLYGKVVSLDEENGRVMVEITMKKETVSLSEFMMQAVTKAEYDKQSKVINSESYEEYKKKETLKKSKSHNSKTEETRKEGTSSKKCNDIREMDKREERRKKDVKYSNGNNRKKEEIYRKESTSSEENRSRHRKKNKKKYSSNESLSSESDHKHKSLDRRRNSSSDSDKNYSKKEKSHRSKSSKEKRDIDKKRKGKKKKRDRDRSPNYKKHRK